MKLFIRYFNDFFNRRNFSIRLITTRQRQFLCLGHLPAAGSRKIDVL